MVGSYMLFTGFKMWAVYPESHKQVDKCCKYATLHYILGVHTQYVFIAQTGRQGQLSQQ